MCLYGYGQIETMDTNLKPMHFINGDYVLAGGDWEISCCWRYGITEDQAKKLVFSATISLLGMFLYLTPVFVICR